MERRSFLMALFGAPLAAKAASAAAWTAQQAMHVPVVRDLEIVRRYGERTEFADLVTSTLRTYHAETSENILRNNPLLQKLQRDRIK